ncbi:MAG: hypothetical protein ABSH08_10200 [Tepidisphaeraceae bacterium]|jgi:hypothetical protein
MATIPTPEQTGRVILSIFGQKNIRPNEQLLFGALHPAFLRQTNMRAADFEPGIQWLEQQAFIDRKGNAKGPYFLTQAEFDEI